LSFFQADARGGRAELAVRGCASHSLVLAITARRAI
jgi:hypothetical protein